MPGRLVHVAGSLVSTGELILASCSIPEWTPGVRLVPSNIGVITGVIGVIGVTVAGITGEDTAGNGSMATGTRGITGEASTGGPVLISYTSVRDEVLSSVIGEAAFFIK